MSPKISAQKRLKLIRRILAGEQVASVARKAGVSKVLLYRWLKRYKRYGKAGLKVGRGGRPFKPRVPKRPKAVKKLSPLERFRMVEEVVKEGRSATKVARKYGVSRITLYKWIKRFQEAPEERIRAVVDRKPYVERYFRQTPELYEEAVLSLIARHPEYGIRRLVANLPKIAGKPIVGHHGVQNILRRHNLSLYEQRLAYAEAQITPVSRAIADAIALASHFFTIPAALRARIIRFAGVFALSAFVTIVVFGLGSYIARSFVPLPPQASPIGLVFATIALFMGSIFFLYSLKYYLTLAIVLSFSQQEGGEGRGERVEGKKGFFSWLLGLNGGNGNGLRPRGASGPVGLTPNLEHISLKKRPYISVHIPFYNEKYVVERAIEAATNFDYPEYEVILCDDSTDETKDIIRDYQRQHLAKGEKLKTVVNKGKSWELTSIEVKPGVTLKHLHRTSRSGFKGGALKLALTLVNPKTEFISVFDADFVPYPDTLTLFLKYFQATAGTLDFQSRNSESRIKNKGKNSHRIAAVQGYQWHVLNKSENWITRGIRSEYAGSYVIERSGTEVYSGLKQISGAVYMIRRDVLEEIGWETSITEDFQLTLKLYEKGYKVVYTPYIQAPAECVSTLKRLVRQRMRWAEGHSNNVRKMFTRLLFGKWEGTGSRVEGLGSREKRFIPSPLTLSEKLEFLYLSPYYLQAFFFLVGTLSWLISETLFPARLPFWTSLWGWSLVLTNMLSLPLMNTVGLFLEESEERDYLGIASFFALSYILVPFQAYASLKGFIEREEGPWFRTPKTGLITDIFTRGKFYRFISGILPGRAQPAVSHSQIPNTKYQIPDTYLSLATANNKFNSFKLKPKKKRWVGKLALTVVLVVSTTLVSFSPFVESSIAQAGARFPEITYERKDFGLDEIPEFYLDLKEPVGRKGLSLVSKAQAAESQVETRVYYKGKKLDIPVEAISLSEGKMALKLKQTEGVKPGRYELRTVVDRGGQRMVISQDFTWGVLAINTNKPVYKPFEEAQLSLAVLDNEGHMACNSKLTLTITNSALGIKDVLTTEDGDIWVNPECKTKDLVTKPDYEAVYQVNAEGEYTMYLVAETKNGTRSFYDSFEVRKSIEFEIERITATRIYPVRKYPVKIIVKPQSDYKGKAFETVPSSFEIISGDYEINESTVVWEVDWKDGEKYELEYIYDAPNDSPEFYSIGPLTIGNFRESRLWHIAVDANTAGNYMIRRNDAETSSVPNAGSNLDDGWDTEVETKGSSITYSDPTFTLASGKYLVLWSERFDTADTTNNERIEVQARLRVNTSEVIPGAGSCYIRKSSGQQECTTQGAAILDIASDSTTLDTRWFRGDNSTTGTVDRFPDWGGIAILALDDTWNYARYDLTSSQTVPDTFTDITWDANVEQDSGFTRTGANIDIANAGRYLVTMSLHINATAGGRFEEVGRLELNGSEIVGTYSSVFIRQSDGINHGIYSWTGIVDVSAGDDLSVGMDNTDGGTTSNNLLTDSSIEILQLPAGNETMILNATTGDWNTSTVTEFAMDTQPYLDAAAFTYTNGNSYFDVDIDDDYLFFTSMWTNNGGARTFGTGRFSVNDTIQTHWVAGRYSRSSGADQPGYSGGTLVTGLNSGDDISLETQALAATTAQNCVSTQGCSISAVRLGSIVDQDLDQQHFRWRNDDNNEALATFAKAEDATFTDFPRTTTYRLRFLVSNDGIDSASNTYQLQVNQTATCTDSGYSAVPTDTSGHWQIVGSSWISAGGEDTTNVSVGGGLSDPTGGTFTAGRIRDDSNTTNSITVDGHGGGEFTEIEFALQATNNSLDNTNYCFRLTNVNTYSQYAEVVVVPEHLWLLFGLGPALPLLLRRKRKLV